MNTNLGNIWSNKLPHTPKINKFNNIFSSKSNINKANSALRSQNNVISGFSKINMNGKNSKKYWGTPTWYLFHSIAAKINEEYYKNNYKMVWQFIKSVCSNLPCPYCRSHAMSYINKINDTQVNIKEKLIDILYNFHNHVNTHSGSKQYSKEKLDVYKKANIQKMFNLFLSRFFKSYYGTRQFQDWNKSIFKVKLREFMEETKEHYDE